jgi:hypothetical protein
MEGGLIRKQEGPVFEVCSPDNRELVANDACEYASYHVDYAAGDV